MLQNNPVKRLYDWVLHWADSRYGASALAVIAFMESSFFPIPPDVLQIALSIGRRKKSLFYALISTVFSVAGAFLGYYIGSALMNSLGWRIIHFYNAEKYFALVQKYYLSNAFFYIFTAAFTPVPYKVFTITAGVCSIPLSTLFFASVIGRGLRFFMVGALIYIFGEKVRLFIDKYFNLLTIVFLVLIAAGFIAVKYMF